MQCTSRPGIRGTFGAAASTHRLASRVAPRILERGGSAIDAPSWNADHFPGSFRPRRTTLNRRPIESRLAQTALDELADTGQAPKVGLPWPAARICACAQRRNAQARRLLPTAANPRGMPGYAVGR